MKKPEIEYPLWWAYTLIGPDEEELRLVIGEVVPGIQHRVKFSHQSTEKRYVSLHLEVWVESEHQRDELFQAFKSDRRVRFVL